MDIIVNIIVPCKIVHSDWLRINISCWIMKPRPKTWLNLAMGDTPKRILRRINAWTVHHGFWPPHLCIWMYRNAIANIHLTQIVLKPYVMKKMYSINIQYNPAQEVNTWNCHSSETTVNLCLGRQWFSSGDNIQCYPLMQSIFIKYFLQPCHNYPF